ncbi:MAG: four helix bundle protein [Sedimentisphaerales bacterium]|nr:four helix bundle protein [Sedimentisphaerales bacterium]
MNERDLKIRTKQFAQACVKLAMRLPDTPLGRHVRFQLIKCSTSVAANYRATCLAQSKDAFAAKISIVVEETDESCFWLEFIIDESLLSTEDVKPLLEEGYELTAIFVSGRKKIKNRTAEFSDNIKSDDKEVVVT